MCLVASRYSRNQYKLINMKNSIVSISIIFLVMLFSCKQGKKNNSQTDESSHNHNETTMDHDHQKTSDASNKKKPLSPVKSTMKSIGDAHIHIEYGAPSVRGRVVWGGLVAFDKVWSTGAHKVSSIDVNKDFIINDTSIPAGKYALFTIPGKEEWAVVINKNWDQHLADDYDATEDILRFKVKPSTLDQSIEQLAFTIETKGNNSAIVGFQWDKISIEFNIDIKE